MTHLRKPYNLKYFHWNNRKINYNEIEWESFNFIYFHWKTKTLYTEVWERVGNPVAVRLNRRQHHRLASPKWVRTICEKYKLETLQIITTFAGECRWDKDCFMWYKFRQSKKRICWKRRMQHWENVQMIVGHWSLMIFIPHVLQCWVWQFVKIIAGPWQ